jgi:hypothetical protein
MTVTRIDFLLNAVIFPKYGESNKKKKSQFRDAQAKKNDSKSHSLIHHYWFTWVANVQGPSQEEHANVSLNFLSPALWSLDLHA